MPKVKLSRVEAVYASKLRLPFNALLENQKEIHMKLKIFAVFFLFLTGSPAYSKYITPLGGPGVDVTRVFIHQNGAISIYIAGETANLDECTSTFRIYIPATVEGKDAMLSVALMAYASGKKIGAHASNCGTTPFWGGTVDVP
ncbi:MAG: hypothetical protein ACI9Y1_001934, partial [Lentisphaeria bacterium]